MSKSIGQQSPDKPFIDSTHVTVSQIADRLVVGDEAVLKWIHSGLLKASNISNSDTRPRWRVAKMDLADFLDRRSNQAHATAKPKSKRPSPKRKFV